MTLIPTPMSKKQRYRLSWKTNQLLMYPMAGLFHKTTAPPPLSQNKTEPTHTITNISRYQVCLWKLFCIPLSLRSWTVVAQRGLDKKEENENE
jgi:hypothetical protein